MFSLSHVKIFLGDEGNCRPLQTPKQKVAHPPTGNHLMCHFDGGDAEKVITF
jgi:hypothetical protein